MVELGPVSQAILDYVQDEPGYIEIFKMIEVVGFKTGTSHTAKWYFRQLSCLAFEKLINVKTYRYGDGDSATIKFQRLPEEVIKDCRSAKKL